MNFAEKSKTNVYSCTTVVAGRHIGHNVQEDHGVVPAVALSHEVDKVAAHILCVNEKMCLLM